MNCKFCNSDNIIKYGTYGGVQLYYCKDCGSKFKDDDTTFHMKTPANQVTSALNMYYEGMSFKAIARNLKQEHGNMPSTATIYEWIQKYTQYATDSIKGHRPIKIGDTWVADETVIEIDGNNVWLWDIIDYDTRFLLATRISRSRTTQDAQMLYDKAVKMAGKQPAKVITDKLASYLDIRYGKNTEHIQSAPFAVEDNTPVYDGEDVEEREDAFDAARGIDHRRDDKRIGQELAIGQGHQVLAAFEEKDVDKGKKVYGDDDGVVGGLDITEIGLCCPYLDKDGGAQEEGHKEDPQKHELLKSFREFGMGDFQLGIGHVEGTSPWLMPSGRWAGTWPRRGRRWSRRETA